MVVNRHPAGTGETAAGVFNFPEADLWPAWRFVAQLPVCPSGIKSPDVLSQLVEYRQSDSSDLFEGTAVRFESGQRPHALDRDYEEPRQRGRILLAGQFAA